MALLVAVTAVRVPSSDATQQHLAMLETEALSKGVSMEELRPKLEKARQVIEEAQEHANLKYQKIKESCDVRIEEMASIVKPKQDAVQQTVEEIVSMKQAYSENSKKIAYYDGQFGKQNAKLHEVAVMMNKTTQERAMTMAIYKEKMSDAVRLYKSVLVMRNVLGQSVERSDLNVTNASPREQDVMNLYKMLGLMAHEMLDHTHSLNKTEVEDMGSFENHFVILEKKAAEINLVKEGIYQSKRRYEIENEHIQHRIDELQLKIPALRESMELGQRQLRTLSAECDNERFAFLNLSQYRKAQLENLTKIENFLRGIA